MSREIISATQLELGAFYDVSAKYFTTSQSWPMCGLDVTLQVKKPLGSERCFGDGERRLSFEEAFARCTIRGPVAMPDDSGRGRRWADRIAD